MATLNLRELLIPKSSRLAITIALTAYGIMYGFAIIVGKLREGTGLSPVESNVILLLVVIATWYLFVGAYLSRREYKNRRALAENVVHRPSGDDYTSVNYSDLAVLRSQLPTAVPIVVGLSLLLLAGMIAGLAAAGLSDPAVGVIIWPLLALLGVSGGWLLISGILRARIEGSGPSRSERYQNFITANNFTALHSSGSGALPIQSNYGPLAFSKINDSVRITSALRGEYRGKPFEFLNIYAEGYDNRRNHYYAVLRRPVELGGPAAESTQIENHVETVSGVQLVDDLVLYNYPTDRAGMMAWFQRLDEIDNHNKTITPSP